MGNLKGSLLLVDLAMTSEMDLNFMIGLSLYHDSGQLFLSSACDGPALSVTHIKHLLLGTVTWQAPQIGENRKTEYLIWLSPVTVLHTHMPIKGVGVMPQAI